MSAWHATMAALTALTAAIAGFAALSLAMDRHWEALHGRGSDPGPLRPWLQGGGSVGLLVSLLACIAMKGGAQGWVAWAGMLTASAFVVVLISTYAPARVPPLTKAMAGIAFVTGLLGVL
jgi:Protein of unknown function (DUF3325)